MRSEISRLFISEFRTEQQNNSFNTPHLELQQKSSSTMYCTNEYMYTYIMYIYEH